MTFHLVPHMPRLVAWERRKVQQTTRHYENLDTCTCTYLYISLTHDWSKLAISRITCDWMELQLMHQCDWCNYKTAHVIA